ncbi:MAG: hypothetical protein IPO21_15290 [Bacteroidales bacterium]|nr:hypothetical protein [Bacteroidales bacterium]
MNTQIISIRIAGVITALFASFHLLFYWLFDWKVKLQNLDLDTWAIFHTFNVCMDFFFILFAFISFRYSKQLINETLGRVWLFSMIMIYSIRIVCEFILWGYTQMQSPVIIILCLIPIIGYGFPLIKNRTNN